MGRKNDELSWYLNRTAVLADFFNGSIYNGEKIIKAEQLGEIQRTYQEAIRDRSGRVRRKRRERDVAGVLQKEGHFVILAVENQENLNFCMPLRGLEYDVEEFAKQLRRMRRQYEQKGQLETGAEYLSGIRKTDRLIPVVTVLFYHGKGKWQAPVQLQEMLDMNGMDETLKAMHMNYRLHVINLTELKEENFETGLRELVGMMKRRDDKEEMGRYCKENAERFENIDDETYDLICTMLNLKTLLKKKEQNRNQPANKKSIGK